jgi:hypothetical protein
MSWHEDCFAKLYRRRHCATNLFTFFSIKTASVFFAPSNPLIFHFFYGPWRAGPVIAFIPANLKQALNVLQDSQKRKAFPGSQTTNGEKNVQKKC